MLIRSLSMTNEHGLCCQSPSMVDRDLKVVIAQGWSFSGLRMEIFSAKERSFATATHQVLIYVCFLER
jgi:hypothetical protein